jgi:predicted transposase YbfD/YdcC
MPKKDPRLVKLGEIVKEELDDEDFEPDFGLFYSIFSPRLEEITDPREQWKVKHILSEIIAIVFFAVLSNENEWAMIEDFARDREEELRHYLTLPGGIPSHDTIERVFSLIDESELERMLVDTLLDIIVKATENDDLYLYTNEELGIAVGDVLAMDGKETRGTAKADGETIEDRRNMNNLHVQSTEYGITLSATRIDEKSNEIPEAQKVLKNMDLKGTVVTADALNTQKGTADVIIESKGDYCLALKSNHKLIYAETGDYFDKETQSALKAKKCYRKETEESSGKKITREYYISGDLDWFEDRKKWKKLTSIGYEKKTTKNLKNGETGVEERYYLCSFPADVELFSICVRRHWHVENLLHWVLDVTFRQDSLRTKNKTALNNLGHVQRFVLSILKILKSYYGKSFKRIREHIGRKFREELPVVFSALKILYDKGRFNA